MSHAWEIALWVVYAKATGVSHPCSELSAAQLPFLLISSESWVESQLEAVQNLYLLHLPDSLGGLPFAARLPGSGSRVTHSYEAGASGRGVHGGFGLDWRRHTHGDPSLPAGGGPQ